MKETDKETIILLYDGDCPLCRNFAQMLRIRESVGVLQLISARQPSFYLDHAVSKGMNLNEGIVLFINEEHYFGADAINALALISSRISTLNKINYWVFKSKQRTKLLYPILRFLRNILLVALGKNKIEHPD